MDHMLFKPTGFAGPFRASIPVSDADLAEALLIRSGWPDGPCKLSCQPGQHPSFPFSHHHYPTFVRRNYDPRWSIPIKARVREASHAHANNELVNVLEPASTVRKMYGMHGSLPMIEYFVPETFQEPPPVTRA
ncbi:hypothetical protein BJV77DRAFT_992547 [Russula vinacea]|nr:hypothetical protein BJV77DRAFT_992547 [Russula vinacea]